VLCFIELAHPPLLIEWIAQILAANRFIYRLGLRTQWMTGYLAGWCLLRGALPHTRQRQKQPQPKHRPHHMTQPAR
jgi:hypothetical protein